MVVVMDSHLGGPILISGWWLADQECDGNALNQGTSAQAPIWDMQ